MQDAVAVITARYNSTRFPGKVLYEFRGKPLLQYLVDTASQVLPVVVATTTSSQPIISYCIEHGITHDISDKEDDLLDRLVQASEGYEYVVRLWGDAPFISKEFIEKALELYEIYQRIYMAIKSNYGEYVAITKRETLLELDKKITEPKDREWVHKYMSNIHGAVEIIYGQTANNVIDTKEQLDDYASRNPA
jgi:spore coat polysaccharide biosynthesis protein SpsF